MTNGSRSTADAGSAEGGLEELVRGPGISLRAGAGAAGFLACTLDVLSVAELVSTLAAARRTGRVEVVHASARRALYFEAGQYTGSTSTHEDDRLGQVLWRTGRVSLDQVLIATEMMKEGKKLGRVLIELGFLEPTALRRGLVDQAVSVFEAACLEERGVAVFTPDVKHPAPIRFGVGTVRLIEQAVSRVRDHRALARRLQPLDKPLRVLAPSSSQPLSDSEQAMLQLATSGQGKLTGEQLVDRSGLGKLHGYRALAGLLEKGLVSAKDPVDPDAAVAVRAKRLCAAINLVIAALDDAGFGVGDAVREYVENPPPLFEEALSGISLDGPLDEDAVLQHGKFVAGGLKAMEAALVAVLDDALMQARDTLPAELTTRLEERVEALTRG